MIPYLREVAELLATHKNGLSTAHIAEAMELPINETRDILSELEEDAVIYSEGHSKGGRLLWFLDQYVFDILTSDRFREKERKCLRCGEMFLSAHAGNRICLGCTEDDRGFDDDDQELFERGVKEAEQQQNDESD